MEFKVIVRVITGDKSTGRSMEAFGEGLRDIGLWVDRLREAEEGFLYGDVV